MAHLEKKIIKGHTYYYACQKGRINGKPRNIWQKYLGTVEDIISAFKGKVIHLPKRVTADIAEFGGSAALLSIAERLRMVEIINDNIDEKPRVMSVGDYMLLAALNRCLSPTSKNRLAEWYSKTCLPQILGFRQSQLTSQRFWDHMSLLNKEKIRMIEKQLSEQMIKEFKIELGCLLYDTTNFFTFIDTFTKGSLSKRGKNKQGRTNLRQVNLALVVTKDFHIPLLHEIYPGNIHDAVEFGSITELLVNRYKTFSQKCEDITIVFDKGNNSKENMELLFRTPFHFVGSLVPTHYPQLLSIPISKFKACKDERLESIKTYRTTMEVFGVERTVVICHNDNLLETQIKTLGAVLSKACKQLHCLQQSLKKAAKRKNGKKATFDGIKKKLDNILSPRHLKDLIEVDLTKCKGNYSLSYTIKRSAVSHLINSLFGKKILFTNHDEWTDEQIVLAYHGQAAIEEAFKRMKDPHFVSWHPQWHWTDQKIEVHGFYCVLALTLASLLRRELYLKGIKLSIPRMFELLKDIRQVALIYPFESHKKFKTKKSRRNITQSDQIILSSMTSLQKKIFKHLNLQKYFPVNATLSMS